MASMLLLTDPNFQELLPIPILCADVAKSPKQYEKYWVVDIIHFKERNKVGHEFVILSVFDCGTNRPLFHLCAERRPSRRKPDEQKKFEPSSKLALCISKLGFLLTSPSDDTISRLRENFKADNYDHLASLNLGSPSLKKLSFLAACQIFEQVENQAWYYELFRRQCYWFCTNFLKRVEGKTELSKIAGKHADRQGTYGRIFGRRIKVLEEDGVKSDIRERNDRQKDQAKKQEDEDREGMKNKMVDAMQRREQERLAALETTRQAIQPMLITTQARQEAEVLAWRSMFSRIVAQPRST
ncbi:uncharacterized protein F5147DRAFT_841043 [Suillus discolor]|uniref:Uncharacterized protein n=1 Tax=Suillus discolor TaxID=1912936 RepID=A0A9P7EUM9_9AGAM|nr:uncharacterized protein F5147DRAFT_841043 [Suillus discolor]KAG2090130.1 hypothetical protein F5147DRAFT_841043 [Suillus discolor]